MAGGEQRSNLWPILEDALEKNGIGICVCGLDGALQYVNRAFTRLFESDVRPGSTKGMITDIAPVLKDMVADARRGNAGENREISFIDSSGSLRRIGLRLSFTGEAAARVLTLVAHDVAHDALDENEEHWHEIADGLEDGYYECDIKGHFLYGNRALCRITEYDSHEFIGLSYKKLYTPEDQKRIYALYHEVYVTGKPNRFIDFSAITKSGRKRLIECSISPARGPDGTIRAFRGIIRDVSEKNRMEKELQRARKLEAIGILSGGIAHDYNNALTAILGNISLAKMEADPENKGLMEVLNDAEEASVRAVDLTRRLSIFARGGKPDRKIINYTDGLRNIIDAALCDYAGNYTITIQEGLWDTDIDEFQIGQVITYILENAVESMKKPGAITITAENNVVEHELSHHELTLQPGKYVRISIADEGSGIAPESVGNIFDPYYTTKEMASGMGLATSYAIIKRHHGYIDVKSITGKGSVFHVYLPVSQDHRQG
ncbi:MAG: PAS domain S-box protein [Spirochaetes bacterium]|nr:PAS domain S-box protein [Spirochaetota bacterium]